ncbi:hypothetical protein NP233_g1173 [Leucocoprinus birnbaumii]|uniref:NADP-dependent oxidoreductase domain-containing protein n=1 Tax=Leucocoprinus birnbaumii TaxID=56174 RepID=A0AAD5YY63_9AGAR|nr:hypothetical protein NP233_g1173 [Leucocoprinus birnbaumii]
MSQPEQKTMQYVRLGNSGLKVSKIILGCMSYGTPDWQGWVLPEEESIKHIKAAYDAGINTFDTANVYSNGLSETILGKAIKQHNLPRDEIVILTKVYFPVGHNVKTTIFDISKPDEQGYVNQHGLSRKHIFDSVKLSLERLQLDYIDVLQCHRFDPETPIEETMQALHDVVKAGYVRYIGMSSCHAWQLAAMQNYAINNKLTPFISMQNHYNLIYREEEREMFPTLKWFGVGSIPWSPLARGVVCKPMTTITKRTETDAWAKGYPLESLATQEIVKRVENIAKKRGINMAQVSLAWVLSKPGVTAPVVGTTSLENLSDLVGAVGIRGVEIPIFGFCDVAGSNTMRARNYGVVNLISNTCHELYSLVKPAYTIILIQELFFPKFKMLAFEIVGKIVGGGKVGHLTSLLATGRYHYDRPKGTGKRSCIAASCTAMVTSIQELGDDILTLVFSWCSFPYEHTEGPRTTLRRVCRRWNLSIISAAEFWSTIRLAFDDDFPSVPILGLECWISRSKEKGLSIHIEVKISSSRENHTTLREMYQDYMDILSRTMSRWKTLTVIVDGDLCSVFSSLLATYQYGSARALQQANISIRPPSNSSDFIRQFGAIPSEPLKQLRWKLFTLDMSQLLARHVNLQNGHYPLSVEQFHNLVSARPPARTFPSAIALAHAIPHDTGRSLAIGQCPDSSLHIESLAPCLYRLCKSPLSDLEVILLFQQAGSASDILVFEVAYPTLSIARDFRPQDVQQAEELSNDIKCRLRQRETGSGLEFLGWTDEAMLSAYQSITPPNGSLESPFSLNSWRWRQVISGYDEHLDLECLHSATALRHAGYLRHDSLRTGLIKQYLFKSQTNYVVMINDLPDNLLDEFFFLCLTSIQHDAAQYIKTRSTLCAVCTLWNYVTTRTTRLWINIYVIQTAKINITPPPTTLRTWLHRSGQAPLSVYIKLCHAGKENLDIALFDGSIDTLSLTVYRWKYLTIELNQPFTQTKCIEMLTLRNATQLVDVYFNFDFPWNYFDPDSILQSLSTLPSLQSLSWWPGFHEDLNPINCSFSSLRKLSISGDSMKYVAHVVNHIPCLTHLTIRLLNCACCCRRFDASLDNRVIASQLEFLSLYTSRDNHMFLDLLDAPKLTVLALKDPVLETEIHEALNRYLARAPDSLRALIIESHFSVEDFVSFLQHPIVSNLKVLEIIRDLATVNHCADNFWTRDVVHMDGISEDIKNRLVFSREYYRPRILLVGWNGEQEYQAFEATPSVLQTTSFFSNRKDRWRRAILGNAGPYGGRLALSRFDK